MVSRQQITQMILVCIKMIYNKKDIQHWNWNKPQW